MLDSLTAEPAAILACGATLGEGPRWHSGEARLYWVDIAQQTLHRWRPGAGAPETRHFDAPVACFAFRRAGGLLLGMKDGCALIDDWDAPVAPFGAQPLAGRVHHRMNDGRTDPAGRFWVGSMNGAKDVADATLYRLNADGVLTPVEGGMTTCNGAAFFAGLSRPQADAAGAGLSRPQADAARFAHSDTPSHAVRIYDCDPLTGELANRRILHQFEPGVGPGRGRPDGGSFDVEGCYWVAMFDGWRVVRLSPAGELLADVRLPVQRPTMIAFGGDDGRTAFVTSATTGLDAAALSSQPLAGGIFAFRVDVPGVCEPMFAG